MKEVTLHTLLLQYDGKVCVFYDVVLPTRKEFLRCNPKLSPLDYVLDIARQIENARDNAVCSAEELDVLPEYIETSKNNENEAIKMLFC